MSLSTHAPVLPEPFYLASPYVLNECGTGQLCAGTIDRCACLNCQKALQLAKVWIGGGRRKLAYDRSLFRGLARQGGVALFVILARVVASGAIGRSNRIETLPRGNHRGSFMRGGWLWAGRSFRSIWIGVVQMLVRRCIHEFWKTRPR